jgi:hypothetical protein
MVTILHECFSKLMVNSPKKNLDWLQVSKSKKEKFIFLGKVKFDNSSKLFIFK